MFGSNTYFIEVIPMKMTFSKSLLAVMISSVVTVSAFAHDVTGAGASFPAPIYAKWEEAYKAATGKAVNYQSIGSSGGIKQIKAKTVDFGATDAPMSGDEVFKEGLVQFLEYLLWQEIEAEHDAVRMWC